MWAGSQSKQPEEGGKCEAVVRKGKVQTQYIGEGETRRVDSEYGGGTGLIRGAGWEPGNCRSCAPAQLLQPGALICTAVHCHLFNDAQAQTCTKLWFTADTHARTRTHTRFMTSLLLVRSAQRRVPAKSHSLSSAEVQRSRGRWYVTESRLCTDLCLCVCMCAPGPTIQAECIVKEKRLICHEGI